MDMRKAFEAKFPVPPGVYWNEDRQRYATHHHESLRLSERQRELWQAWQAAHAAALPPGFVAVPVEATDEMCSSFCAKKDAPTFLTHTTVVIGDFNSRYAAMLAARPEVK